MSQKTIGEQTTTNYYFIPLSQNSHSLCLSFSHQSSVAVAENDKSSKIEMGVAICNNGWPWFVNG